MPLHDWTRVDAGIYHHFHNEWITTIHARLMTTLPSGYYSLTAQHAGRYEGDVVAMSFGTKTPRGTTATLPRPQTKVVRQDGATSFRRQRRIELRHVSDDRIVSVIEIVSDGNKSSSHAAKTFVSKAQTFLVNQIHLLVVDPLPRTTKVPDGFQALIADDEATAYALSDDEPFAAFAYECDNPLRLYLEPFALRSELPVMPLFLEPDFYINLDLEAAYGAAWAMLPERWREIVAPS